MMNKEELENFGIWCREYKELISIPIRDLQKLYREFCNSSSHNKTPKVRINKDNGSLCDNYARCRQSKKHALDCVNDIKYGCFKHERS